MIMEVLSKYSFKVFALKSKRTNDVDTALNRLARDFKGDYEDLKNNLNSKVQDACPNDSFVRKLNNTDFFNEYNSTVRLFFLWNYENYLRSCSVPAYNTLPISSLFEQEERLKFSAEHIHAQKSKFQFETIEETEEFKKSCLNSIGNLVLDSRSANSSKGRNDWNTKEISFFSSAPLISQNELRQFLESIVWDSHAVERRKEKLINEFSLRFWG